MGEREGNAPLASVVAVINDFLPEVEIFVNEKSLYKVSKLVETFSGFRAPVNKPVLGDNVFTQTTGIHANGDIKRNLYFNDLIPERFGRKSKYALGKTSGKANLEDSENLNAMSCLLWKIEDKKIKEVHNFPENQKDVNTFFKKLYG